MDVQIEVQEGYPAGLYSSLMLEPTNHHRDHNHGPGSSTQHL